jgi:endonuclease/exonuclease/phosphatase family metal-dependent hydrolase
MRVATFNLRHGVGVDAVLDLDRSVGVIDATGADLVGLQELDRGVRRSGGVDQPRRIAELTGMDVRFHSTVRTGGGEYGIGVATRAGAAAKDRWMPLPRRGHEEPRGAIVVRYPPVNAIVTHITHPGPAQGPQLRALAELASELGPRVVLLGDLNIARHDLGPLISAGLDPGPEHTTMVMKPGVQIDFIMTGPAIAVSSSWTVDMRASDHVALVADLVVE